MAADPAKMTGARMTVQEWQTIRQTYECRIARVLRAYERGQLTFEAASEKVRQLKIQAWEEITLQD